MLLREVMTEASFPADGVEKAREVIQASIRAGRDSSTAYSFDLFRRAFFGAEHLLFGTDMPYDSEVGFRQVREVIASIEGMDISSAEKKLIYEDNARKLLKLAV